MGQLAECGGELFTDSGNEPSVGVDHEHGEAVVLNDAERSSLGVEREGGDRSDAKLGGGVLHGLEHFRGGGTHRDEVEIFGDIVRGDDGILASEDTGSDAGQVAA